MNRDSRVAILVICVVLIVMVILLGLRSHGEVRETVRTQYGEQQLMLARQAASSISEFANERVTIIEILARDRSGDPVDNITRCFQTIYTKSEGFYSIEYINASGVVVYGYPEERAPIGYDLYAENRSDIFEAVRDDGETRICRPTYLFEGGLGSFIWVPVHDGEEFRGVILAIIRVSTISDKFIAPLMANRTGYVYMMDNHGQMLYNGELFERPWNGWTAIQSDQASGKEGTATCSDATNEEYIVAYAPVRWRDQLWSVGVLVPESEVDSLIRSVYKEQMIFLGAVIAIITGGSGGLILMFSRWNKRLEAKVKAKTCDLVRTNEELTRANKQLKELDKLKSEFVSMVSHELKTPLAAMKTSAQVLQGDGIGGETRQEMLNVILRNIDRQTKLVTDLLDLSRIESGRMKLDKEKVSLGDIIEDAVENVRQEAEGKGLRLDIDLPEGLSPIYGDSGKLRQVLINLLDNAIKFTAYGGRIGIKVRELNGQVELRISDTGVGIPAEELERIFDKFYQVGGAQTRGTGLGLAICKGIIEAHGGRIWAESRPGEGSTFVIVLNK